MSDFSSSFYGNPGTPPFGKTAQGGAKKATKTSVKGGGSDWMASFYGSHSTPPIGITAMGGSKKTTVKKVSDKSKPKKPSSAAKKTTKK